MFSEVERLVLDYTDRLVRTPVDVPDDLVEQLREHFSEPQLVELTSAIAWENYRARFNRGLDVQPMGFSQGAYCVLPARPEAGAP